MENYVEYLIKKKFSSSDKVKCSIFIAVLLVICGGVSLSPLGWPSGLVVLAFGGYGCYYLVSGFKKEFEYILTNDHLDVDMITAGRSRKRLCSFDIEAVELCARVSDPDKKGEMKRSFTKVIQAASSPDAENARFLIFSAEDGINMLIFEPNDRIIDGMSIYARSKFFK